MFFPSLSFFLFFYHLMPRDNRVFFCAGQFSGVQTRSIVIAHAPLPPSLPLSSLWTDNSGNPFLPLSFSLKPPRFQLPRSCSHSTTDLNMQNDFFLRHRGSFPCLVHRAHIITGWQENNAQKTIDEKTDRARYEPKGKKNKERKKGDIAIRLVTRVHSIPQRGERGGMPLL